MFWLYVVGMILVFFATCFLDGYLDLKQEKSNIYVFLMLWPLILLIAALVTIKNRGDKIRSFAKRLREKRSKNGKA